ncbi:hypothetical protein J2X31_001514 [Flavobacterium arsenatis]|uniref:Secretion system C-terminal sorting domain-containing protein n=1 Tax=Flavobacterium arsenatis TaxID=1484332 RepID=A0ABU1TNQ7_9FLAO|nr:T9SS type A sorting domain-containing protein [Flavobacterium arsenatis]MDR6967503.1 hypothetical protein [Flavobacterium arsenatis]
MKTKLFLIGLLSFLYVSSQESRLVEVQDSDKEALALKDTPFYDGRNSNLDLAPTNDECDTAIELTINNDYSCGTVTPGTLFEATDSGIEGEIGTANDDVWFFFIATNEMHKVSLENVQGSVVMELMSGTCSNLNVIAFTSSPTMLVVGNLEVGTPYYVRVYSSSDEPQETTFDICVGTPPGPPSNDDCANAIPLTVNTDYLCGTVTGGTIHSATDSGIEADFGQADDDVWFSFTALASTHKIQVNNIVASTWQGMDLAIEVFAAECTGNLVVSSDPETFIVSNLVPETVYYVRVYSFYDYIVDTTFDICIGTPPPPPANDECSGAVALTVSQAVFCSSPTSGTLQSATDSGVEWQEGNADDDVWYSFVALSTSHLIFLQNIQGNDTDLAFEVLGGICGEQNSVQGFYANNGIVDELEIGNTYYVRVYTYYDNPNPNTIFSICISTPGPPPVNDQCDAAIELTVNEDYNCQSITSGTITFATDSDIETNTGNPDDDVWYRFTALSDTQKVSLLNIVGTTSDFVIEIFDSECGGEIIVSSDPQTFVVDELFVGSEYFLRVFTYSSEFHFANFDICIGTMPQSQPNDECEDAIPLTVNTNGLCEVTTTSSLAAATYSGIESEQGSPDDDVWFSFVATGTSHKLLITEQDDFETLSIEVFDGTCGEFILISNPESPFVDDLEIGTTYYVRVFSFSQEPVNTTFGICLTQRQVAPVNDECEGAVTLTVDADYCNGVLNNGTNLGSTGSDWDSSICMNDPQNDVWFSFTVPANVASVNISTNFTGASISNTIIALYNGACGNLTEMECNDNDGNSAMSTIEGAEVNVGETYYVRVVGYSQLDEGNFCLEVTTNENLSKDDFEKNTLKAYPNPVKNLLNLSNASEIRDVAIFNLLGQEVVAKAVNANNAQLDLSQLTTGAYLVKISSDNAIQTIKIIKE